jgi:cytochrome c553
MHRPLVMTRAIGCLVILAIGCGRAAAPAFPEGEALGEQHVARAGDGGGRAEAALPPGVDRAKVRFHMQRHFDDLRRVERLLIAGKLEDAKSLAFLLSRPARDPGLEAWAGASARVADAALALAGAASLPAACRLEPRVAAACADCHRSTGALLAFDRVPPAPPDDPELCARMARHQWAADRLWEGLVGPSDRAWSAGLEVFAAAPLPSASDSAGVRLQGLARAALAALPRDTPADRAKAYGEMLVTCTACHAGPAARPFPVDAPPRTVRR